MISSLTHIDVYMRLFEEELQRFTYYGSIIVMNKGRIYAFSGFFFFFFFLKLVKITKNDVKSQFLIHKKQYAKLQTTTHMFATFCLDPIYKLGRVFRTLIF